MMSDCQQTPGGQNSAQFDANSEQFASNAYFCQHQYYTNSRQPDLNEWTGSELPVHTDQPVDMFPVPLSLMDSGVENVPSKTAKINDTNGKKKIKKSNYTFDGQLKRRSRQNFSPSQVRQLETVFEQVRCGQINSMSNCT